ncbi:MAG TPA: AI-2E family transporter, partial [Ferruginibacter sp.]|nr:AI-2E family transporter [Ferruginibacter sp.]
TLYILSRTLYLRLIYKRKWKRGWTALLFLLCYLVIIALPVYLCITLVSPKIMAILENPDEIMKSIRILSAQVKDATGMQLFTDQTSSNLSQKISGFIPRFLNSTLNMLANLIMMFFLLYYLLYHGRSVEKYLNHIIPFEQKNVDKLASETKVMVRANALGIPIICIVQGATAALGYWIFGLEDWGMWGFVTGVFAFFPIVGTMVVWVPLVVFLFATGHSGSAWGLTLYSFIVTGNVDYITRLGLLRKLGNVHPMITVMGVIVGLNLFGFIGLIFGPLLISYFIALLKIYMNEFTSMEEQV